jgi:hypothetical protein
MRSNLAFVLVVLAACGGSSSKPMPDAPSGPVGFSPPKDSLKVCLNASGCMDSELTPADLSCLDTASTDQATTVAVTLNTVVLDFQNQTPVASATVIAFDGINYGTPWDAKMSDAQGNITFQVPGGRTRFGFKMTATDTMPTFLLNQYLNPDPAMTTQMLDKIQSVSINTANTLPALIDQTRMQGTGVLAGALRDCQHHEIANFIGTLSSTSGTATPVAGAESYYFNPGVNLPVRTTQRPMASYDGLFMVIQVQPTATAYAQMWGYPTPADLAAGTLTLISELPVPVLGDTVITGSFEPKRQ